MKRSVVAAVVAAAWSAAVVAQSGVMTGAGQTMGRMNKMEKSVQATYVGCLEAGSAAGTFRLTHADRMDTGSMKKNAMDKDAMAKDSMSHDMMAPTSLALTSSSVNLRKNVGRKVAVAGSESAMHKDSAGMDAPTFTVKALKVVAASCS